MLSDRCLYYFQHTAENVPKGIIPLENVKVRLMEDSDGKRFLFEVYSDTNPTVKGCKTDSKGTVVQGNHKTYRYRILNLQILWRTLTSLASSSLKSLMLNFLSVPGCLPVARKTALPGFSRYKKASRKTNFMTLLARRKPRYAGRA